MKKLIALLLLLSMLTLMFSSCGSSKIEKPEDTNLEYWLFDKPNEENLTLLQSDGSYKRYLAPGSEHIEGNSGYVSNCVYYETTRTSIGLMNRNRICNIIITDPDVTLWGLTINSTYEEFHNTLTQVGFKETYRSEEYGYSSFEFVDVKRVYTINVGYTNDGSSIQIYCRNRNYWNEFLEETGIFNVLTKIYIWLEEDVF